MAPSDRDLGMKRSITRRDFLNGVAVGVAGVLAQPHWLWALEDMAPEKTPGYYPPALTGLRGSHEGAYEVAHALRDGAFWATAGRPVATGESYDLVVVGGGISGLSAAYFFRKVAGPDARVLILDNHDDFGGHAKRNEFRHNGRVLIGFGGTFAIESPAPYSAVARGLIEELGIDVAKSARVYDRSLYPSLGLKRKIFFDKETFGTDRLVPDPGGDPEFGGAEGPTSDTWKIFMAEAPLSQGAKRDIARLYQEKTDYLPGLSSAEKKARLSRTSYADFLVSVARMDSDIVPFFQARTHSLYGVGIDAVSALDAWGLGHPGFQGLGLDPSPGPGMGLDAIPNEEADSYFFHFPDGNASIARLLVRSLVPTAIPGKSTEDLVTARADYARLDEPSSRVRIRLNSTVVQVRHVGPPNAAQGVEATYARGGKLRSVQAARCVLACWNGVIPHICAELPEQQKEALSYGVKVPIVYTNVLIRTWTSFQRLGVRTVHAPGSYHSGVSLDLPVSMGEYRCSRAPAEPIVLHLVRTPCSPGLPARQQHRAGRVELLGTRFEAFERHIRDQLARMLSPGGFDPARDILAITVNRWPHGYAYQYNSLWDDFWRQPGGSQPCVVGRKLFGRIAIANADAAAYAYTDAAIDQAHRAVTELLALSG
jgi:spermidine dehydrogenase